ncbi:hypothetical protein QUF72_16810 [Desulfobacterales bacterium HSG2]|nr:hypothetical protein [Desulfobacterales bacterium HSG2]
MSEFPNIIGIKVADHRGEQILAGIGTAIDQNKKTLFINKAGEQLPSGREDRFFKLFWHSFPIRYVHETGTDKVGEATVYSGSSVVFENVRTGFAVIVFSAILKTALLWIIFLWVSRSLLARPLLNLTRAVMEKDFDNLEDSRADMGTSGHNELKILEEEFNALLRKLRDGQHKLRFRKKKSLPG